MKFNSCTGTRIPYTTPYGSEEDEYEEDMEDLFTMCEVISPNWYLLLRNVSAGRHNVDFLEAYMREHPENAFLVLFRMYRISFWQIVDINRSQ